MLAALEMVDMVIVFGEDTPLRLIRRVRPKVLIKEAVTTSGRMWSALRSSKPTAESDSGRSCAGPFDHGHHPAAVREPRGGEELQSISEPKSGERTEAGHHVAERRDVARDRLQGTRSFGELLGEPRGIG